MKPDGSREFTVTWAIEVYADTPEEAARGAEEIMMDPASTAKIFTVRPFPPDDSEPVEVDLEDYGA